MAKRGEISSNIVGSVLSIETDAGTIYVDATKLTSEIQHTLMMHGLKQKVCDGSAIARDPKTGRSASIEEKYAAMRAIADMLQSGAWTMRKEGDGSAKGGLLFRALCEVYTTRTPAQIREWLDGKSGEEKKALALVPKIKAVIDRLEAEKVSKGIDTDSLLDGLE